MIRVIDRVRNQRSQIFHSVYEIVDVPLSVTNCIRHMFSTLPTWSFQYFKGWDTNIKAYYPEQIKLKLQDFPVNIEVPYETVKVALELEKEATTSAFEKVISFEEKEAKKAKEIEDMANNFTIEINAKNTTTNIKRISTDSAGEVKYYHKGSEIPNPYPVSLEIHPLLPGEYLKVGATVKLGIPITNRCYETANVFVTYNEEAERKFIMTIMRRNFLTEDQMLHRTCAIICLKLEDLHATIKKSLSEYTSTDKTKHLTVGKIAIDNDNGKFALMIAEFLQEHAKIKSAASPRKYEGTAYILYNTDGSSIIPILDEVFDKLIKLFTKFTSLVKDE